MEAKDLLRHFLPAGPAQAIAAYRAMRDELERRPTILEIFNQGFVPRSISAGDGWFAFAQTEGDLHANEAVVLGQFGDWLKMLETTSLTKSYKMVVLRVLLDQGTLVSGVDLNQFARSCRRYLQNHEVLRRDLLGDGHAVDHALADDPEWTKWWNCWPIDRWADLQAGHKWFVREGDRFRFARMVPDDQLPTLEAMTSEIVDWRLAQYARRWKPTTQADGLVSFEAKVSHANGRPILFVPEKTKCPGRPYGPTAVTLPDGSSWQFRFVKVACNVAMPAGETTNQLGRLLQRWFGPNAGLPGTNFTVRFETKGGEWSAAPAGVTSATTPEPPQAAAELPAAIRTHVSPGSQYSTHVPVYDVSAAAGDWGPEGSPTAVGWMRAANHRLTHGMFAAKVLGHSMEPTIPSDSWCLFRPCPAGSREGRLLLVQVNSHFDPEDGGRYTVKRYHSTRQATDEGWVHSHIELQPLNTAYRPIVIDASEADEVRIIGEWVAVLDT